MDNSFEVDKMIIWRLKRIADNIEREIDEMPKADQWKEEELLLEAAIHAGAMIVLRSIRRELE